MNARSQLFEYTVEVGQAEEVVLSLFHTLLLHRTQGKIRRSAREAAGGESSSSLSIGSLGFEDVDCDLVDFSYVRCASPTLCARVGGSVRLFVDELQRTDAKNGRISMEFYKRRRGPWLLNAETMPWEVWTVQLAVTTLPTEYDRQTCREELSELLAEGVLNIAESLSRGDLYVPHLVNYEELDLIFETEFPDVQPFLFRIMHRTDEPARPSASSAFRKLIRDTLSL